MGGWRIPPLGYCARCLVRTGEENPALAILEGTSLCRNHLGGHAADPLILPSSREEG